METLASNSSNSFPSVLISNRISQSSRLLSGINMNNIVPFNKSSLCDTVTKFGLMNFRSVRNKTNAVFDFVSEYNVDLFGITETWLNSEGDDALICDLTPAGYSFIHAPRKGKGGGIGLIYKSQFKLTVINGDASYLSFEHLNVHVDEIDLNLVVLYRPPPSANNNLNVGLFYDEFDTFLQSLNITKGDILVTGDFNFHMDNKTDFCAQRFADILSSYDFVQHVKNPTHKHGHILDLILSPSTCNIVSNVSVFDIGVSDHFALLCNLDCHKLKSHDPSNVVSYRKIKSIDMESFMQDIIASNLFPFEDFSLDELIENYNHVLSELLDKHAPIVTKNVSLKKKEAPWFNDALLMAKRQRRCAERKWRKSKLTVDKEIFLNHCRNVRTLISQSKRIYFKDIICNNSNDPRFLFKTVKSLVTPQSFPSISFSNQDDIADKFCSFFHNKVATIRSTFNLQLDDDYSPNVSNASFSNHLSSFCIISEEDVKSLLFKIASKTSKADPLPTYLVKACSDVLLPVITRIINLSLSTASVPCALKSAIITPVPKKPLSDSSDFSNFRPISNLPFLAKLIEKVVSCQLQCYLLNENLLEPFQSAYKTGHSTETALTRIHNDILVAMDNHKLVLLVLLDLSAAFDTVDHSILLTLLEKDYHIESDALSWFISYLNDRSQCVHIFDKVSQKRDLQYGVPQGSVLGPILFSLYTRSISDVIRKHGISFHQYADDTQLYLSFDKCDISNAFVKMEHCISDLCTWMDFHKLKLNTKKTEFIVFRSKFLLSDIEIPNLSVGGNQIHESNYVRNLGVFFDSRMSFDKHISMTCKAANMHLRNISHIRKFLDQKTAEILIHAFVSSKLDFCNSLLFSLPKHQLQRIQKIQNTAARIATKSNRFEHITPVLHDLHWLPISSRINFKILLLCFRALHFECPVYMNDLVAVYDPPRNLRSSSKGYLVQPDFHLQAFGNRCFTFAAASLWNQLPDTIRSCKNVDTFKKHLKTYLFRLYYK